MRILFCWLIGLVSLATTAGAGSLSVGFQRFDLLFRPLDFAFNVLTPLNERSAIVSSVFQFFVKVGLFHKGFVAQQHEPAQSTGSAIDSRNRRLHARSTKEES